jgi:hypothetical protein
VFRLPAVWLAEWALAREKHRRFDSKVNFERASDSLQLAWSAAHPFAASLLDEITANQTPRWI